MREPSKTDFKADVDGVGSFMFARRTMRDEIRVGSKYSKLVDGDENPVSWLRAFANAFAALEVLTVQAPDGWDLEGLDPLDPDSYAKLMKVYNGLRDKELSFRGGTGA